MEEWIDSGSSSNGREEGDEGESPIQPNTSHLTTNDDLGGILTQQELEENFDLKVDCFSDLDTPDEEGGGPRDCSTRGEEQVPSDPQLCERQMCQKTASCSVKAGDSNQTSSSLGTAGSVDTPPFVQPNPPSNRTTNMIVPDPYPHVTGGMSGPSPHVAGGMSGLSPHVTGGVSGPSPHVTGGMSGPSPHVTGGTSDSSPPGTILVSSREVTYSQVS